MECIAHAPSFGRWVRAHAGNRFDERVDKLAKMGLCFEKVPRRVFWRDVGAAAAALGAAHAQIHPELLDLPAESIYDMITRAHRTVSTAIREQVPKAQPRRPWFDTHYMRLVDRRNEARCAGAAEAEIQAITREIGRECRKTKGHYLIDAVAEKDWAGIRQLKGFRAQQARIKNTEGRVILAGRRAQTTADYFQSKFQNVQWATAELEELPERPALYPEAGMPDNCFSAQENGVES